MSLYIKYRPSNFTNLVGQSFVKNTLQKAIENKKTVGAYLFCGPRGTGKTSTARLLAKSINCENLKNGNPCLKCSICTAFAEDRLVDIIEIDAASHTGVDNIRDIIEKAQFTPNKTKFKVYIIDEVHMLSKGAFNALLKILEEPPSHVKFILATTETHKIPETIISRCQRYDFKRISDKDIKDRLTYIAKEEEIIIDEKSIQYIIKNSSGGLRNAISTFEQLITNGEISYSAIVKKLEIVDESTIEDFLIKLINKDSSVISIIEKNILDGKNIKLFFKELLFFTKNKTLEFLKKGENITDYINILEILDDTYSKTKNSLDENITFTIGVLKILNGINKKETHTKEASIKTNSVDTEKSKTKEILKNNNQITTNKENNSINNNAIIENKALVSNKDISDVFGDKDDNINIIENNGDFNINDFITSLQKNKVKSSNINTIKNSNLEFKNDILTITPANSFLKKTIDKVEIIQLFTKSLLDAGISNPTIKIN